MQIVMVVVSLSLSSSSLFVRRDIVLSSRAVMMTPMPGISWYRLTPVASGMEAVVASSISTDGRATTVTVRRSDRGFAGPSTRSPVRGRGVETAVTAPGAGPPTGAAGTVVVIGRDSASPTRTDGNRQSLDYTGLTGSFPREKAIVDRKVSAYHISPGSRSVLCQLVGFVFHVSGVLPVIDSDGASVTVGLPVRLEKRVWPVTALAKAWNTR